MKEEGAGKHTMKTCRAEAIVESSGDDRKKLERRSQQRRVS
jgi:hypothetical protein